MRRDLREALRLLAFPTLALLVVLAFAPGRLGLAVRIYALILCAAVLGYAIKALRRSFPPAAALYPAARRTARQPRRPPSLRRFENEAALGVAGAFDLHHRLRPRLRPLAEGLLATRRRVSLDGDPAVSRRVLGDGAWEIVRPGRPPPEDRLARGIPISELRSVVESLERM